MDARQRLGLSTRAMMGAVAPERGGRGHERATVRRASTSSYLSTRMAARRETRAATSEATGIHQNEVEPGDRGPTAPRHRRRGEERRLGATDEQARRTTTEAARVPLPEEHPPRGEGGKGGKGGRRTMVARKNEPTSSQQQGFVLEPKTQNGLSIEGLRLRLRSATGMPFRSRLVRLLGLHEFSGCQLQEMGHAWNKRRAHQRSDADG